MDKFMSTRWQGINDVNCSFMDYSTSYFILNGDRDSLRANTILSNLWKKMTKYDKAILNHNFKFNIWQKSMELRYAIEGCFTILLTFIFQYYLTAFNKYMHEAMVEAFKIREMIKEHAPKEDILHEKEILHHEL